MEETVVCGLMNELDAQWTVEERVFQVEKSENRNLWFVEEFCRREWIMTSEARRMVGRSD